MDRFLPLFIRYSLYSFLFNNRNIFCPFDRQPTSLGPNGVWDLNKNFALLELLEKLEENDREMNLALDRERELSVTCDENEDHVAVVYCTTCATHLCEQVWI